jgi:hypothetical protein
MVAFKAATLVLQFPADKVTSQVAKDRDHLLAHRIARSSGDVGRQDYVWQVDERTVRTQGLLLEHIKSCRQYTTGHQRASTRLVVQHIQHSKEIYLQVRRSLDQPLV